ncbi:non-ribosomal peptide synthetase [Microbispora bryophytorum]|uniref:non-ribosomal peptide synthetase n=1 Tax=Microbispora bryophytorum TaxID=1460882 RepID=UPI0033CEAAEF
MNASHSLDMPPEQVLPDGDGLDELLSLGLGTPLPEEERPPVHELVARLARTRPDGIAVHSGGEALAYRDLHAWSGRIAARLAAAGVASGDRVAVLAEPSTAMVASVLGVLRAGAAYVPLDLGHPDGRIAEVLRDARVAAAVVTPVTAPRLPGLGVPLVDARDAAGDGAGETETGVPAVTVTAGDAAYVIYTSGSTGEPKGVVVEHGQLAASTLARRLVYPGPAAFLLVSPLAFDSSVAGLWGTLTAGGRLVVATADEVRDPERLAGLIEEHRVTRLLCVPSLYRVLLDAAERAGRHVLSSLETVVVAGEALPEELVKRHFRLHHPRPVTLVNEYGPTEATVWASYRRFDGPGPVSIGVPVPGVRLYVLDETLRPVPRGTEGELCIGGAGVSRGYLGRPDQTAAAFVEDPFAGFPGARMYRTGDIVRWNDDGTLDFRGRRDHQVKIRGHRVELGAVEEALRGLPGVRDAAVVPDGAHTRLTGFVVAVPGTLPEPLREQLTRRLPEVMVPARIEMLDALPVTVNGKVDRAALSAAAERSYGGGEPAQAVARGDDLTSRVAAAWAEVLKRRHVPADVNFFDLGGNSLAMFQLQDALERHTGTRPSVVSLFRRTTVAAQAALIRDGGATAEAARPGGRHPAGLAARARRQRARGQESAR